jgi:hypothetical protein
MAEPYYQDLELLWSFACGRSLAAARHRLHRQMLKLDSLNANTTLAVFATFFAVWMSEKAAPVQNIAGHRFEALNMVVTWVGSPQRLPQHRYGSILLNLTSFNPSCSRIMRVVPLRALRFNGVSAR